MSWRNGAKAEGRKATAPRAGIFAPLRLCAFAPRLCAFAALLAACSAQSDPDTLRFWAFGREGEVVQELVRDFVREHPGPDIRVQQMPWSAAHEKLLTAIVGRATPDLAQMGNTWIPEMVTLGALAPVGARLPDSSYFAGIVATNVVADTLFGVPWYVDTRVLFYRKDILASAGYAAMPDTWDGWREAMLAMKRVMAPGAFPIFLPINEWPPMVILGLQQGATLVTEDGFGGFRQPGYARAFEFLLSLYRDGLAAPVSNTEMANLYQEFARGSFAMYITGPWNLGEFRRRLPDDLANAWATAPLPGPTGAESGVSLAGGSSLVVFRASRHRARALELIEYLSRPEQQARFYRLTGDLPARREAWSDPVLAGDREADAFRQQLERTVPTPMVPEWEEVTTKVMDHTEAAVRGGKSAAAALAAMDADVDRLLERRRYLRTRRTGGMP
jgi:multiple sugar transport system substrate-binding protein